MKRNQHIIKTGSAALAAGLIALTAAVSPAHADDAKPDAKKEEPKKSKWESTATVGVTLTRGNSKTFLANGNIATKRVWTSDEMLLGASAGYGESTTKGVDNLTDSYVKGFGQWNHLFSPQTFGGLRLTGEHDDIAAVTYRAVVSPLLGYYFVKQTNAFLVGEIGPSYVREDLYNTTSTFTNQQTQAITTIHDDNVHNYIALRVAERGEWKFASGAKVWESVEWLPKVQDFNSYVANFEIGVSAPISKALSVSLVLQDTYRNGSAQPKGKLQNDLKLIAGLAYNF